MAEILRVLSDGAWQGVGAIVGAILAGIGIWVTVKQRSTKALSYEILASCPIASIHPEAGEELVLSYRGEKLERAGIVTVRLVNNGQIPIIEADFTKPIELMFPDRCRISAAEIQAQEPSNLGAQHTVTAPNRIQLSPVLFNPGDSVRLKVILANFASGIDVQARIAGVQKIAPLGQRRSLITWKGAIGLSLIALGAYLGRDGLPSLKGLAHGGIASLLGYLAATLTTMSFVPQAWLVLRTRHVAGVSLGMYSTFTLGVLLWLTYGMLVESWPLIVANAITFALAMTVMGVKLRKRPITPR